MTTPKMELSMSNIFDVDLQSTDKPLAELEMAAKAKDIDNLEKQRDYVKNNLVKIIERGMTSLSDLNAIANASEKSRDFEVLATLMKTLVDTNIQLLDVEVAHKAKLEVKQNASQEATTINNNTVFVGQTKDLAAYLKSHTFDG